MSGDSEVPSEALTRAWTLVEKLKELTNKMPCEADLTSSESRTQLSQTRKRNGFNGDVGLPLDKEHLFPCSEQEYFLTQLQEGKISANAMKDKYEIIVRAQKTEGLRLPRELKPATAEEKAHIRNKVDNFDSNKDVILKVLEGVPQPQQHPQRRGTNNNNGPMENDGVAPQASLAKSTTSPVSTDRTRDFSRQPPTRFQTLRMQYAELKDQLQYDHERAVKSAREEGEAAGYQRGRNEAIVGSETVTKQQAEKIVDLQELVQTLQLDTLLAKRFKQAAARKMNQVMTSTAKAREFSSKYKDDELEQIIDKNKFYEEEREYLYHSTLRTFYTEQAQQQTATRSKSPRQNHLSSSQSFKQQPSTELNGSQSRGPQQPPWGPPPSNQIGLTKHRLSVLRKWMSILERSHEVLSKCNMQLYDHK